MNDSRRSLRPPVGLPTRTRRSSWQGTLASVALHALVLVLILSPAVHSGFTGTPAIGAGGSGAAGGGGGGSGSAARSAGDRLQFVTVRPPPAPPAEVAEAVPDVSQVAPPPQPAPVEASAPAVSAGEVVAAGAGQGGTGAGTGAGAGPGSGGGVGSGVGTGSGSGVGPGTGGGPGEIHPPTPTQFFLPPLPAPERIRPYHLIAWFDVDERGNATLLGFNPSRDGGYNRRLREVLLAMKFRPAVRADGTPVRDTVDIHYIF